MKTIQITKEYLSLLKNFISFKSISTDPAYKTDCVTASAWLAKLFGDNGFEVVVDEKSDSNPLVLAKYTVDEDAKTIAVYGHYDVQPATYTEAWLNDPFELSVYDDKLIARGAVDNKGQVLVHIYTVLELIKAGMLKYNVVFIIEGNEESGNPDLPGQLLKYKDFIGANTILISDGEITKDYPTMEVSFRGGSNIRVTCKTSDNDMHSGMCGGAVPNSALTLAKILSKLKDDENTVLVPGFYDGLAITLPEVEVSTHTEILELTKVKRLFIKEGHDFYSEVGQKPTLEISGLNSGYTGVGYLNIVPCSAEARINIRTAGNQKTSDVVKRVLDFIYASAPEYADINIQIDSSNDPVYLESDSTMFKDIKSMLEDVYDKPVITRNVGGSIPIISNFVNDLGMEVISVSLGNEDCNMHGVNENFKLWHVEKGLEFSKRFFSK